MGDTTSMAPATLTSTGAPRVFTWGIPQVWPRLLLRVQEPPGSSHGGYHKYGPGYSYEYRSPQGLHMGDTTSMAPATLTSTGAPRVFTRGMPLVPATRLSTAPTATGTTARTPSTVSRSMATRPTFTRTVTDTEALSGHAKEHENVPVVRLRLLLKAAHP